MNRMLVTTSVLAIAALAACSQQSGTTTGDKKSGNVAVVDGAPISRQTYVEYAKVVASKTPEELTEDQRNTLLENLVRAQVLAKAAESNGVAKDEKTVAALELSRLNILTQAMTENYLKDKKATEAELRAEYDRQAAGMEKQQFRASHILVGSEEAAKQVIAQLKAGAKFEQLAARLSTDTSSKDKGGDLEWFALGAVTPPFAEALKTLKKGDTVAAPVQTEFGWHVIRLTDVRDSVPPPYESVKDRLANPVEGKKFREYVDGLIAKAKITKSL